MSARFHQWILGGVLCGFAVASHADIYSAEIAYQEKDFARAFELFREIAELGNPLAQETLAIMYVQGEGVARNNALGFAWAQLAKENGLGVNVQPIIDQVGPHLSADGLKAAEEVRGKFGKAALEMRLIPLEKSKALAAAEDLPKRTGCSIEQPANPANYYPSRALIENVSGSVVLRVNIMPDGHARNPQVLYSVPPKSFDAAARQLARDNLYAPRLENGTAVPCVLRFRVRFTMADFVTNAALRAELARLEKAAGEGDPLSQFQIGMLKSGWKELNPEGADFTLLILKAAQAGLAAAQYVVGIDAVESLIPGNHEKGLAWLELAAASGSQEAHVALAKERVRSGTETDIASARELLEKAVGGGSEEGAFYLADLMNGETDTARRDPARVLKLVGDAFVIRERDPAIMEVRAAALSQLGDFEGAKRLQETAVGNARRMRWDVTAMQERLALYEKSQPWVGRVLVY